MNMDFTMKSNKKPHIHFHTGLWWCSMSPSIDGEDFILIAHHSPVLAYLAWKQR